MTTKRMTGEIETEIHFLLHETFNYERANYFKTFSNIIPVFHSLNGMDKL